MNQWHFSSKASWHYFLLIYSS